jgi:hypothetical protein
VTDRRSAPLLLEVETLEPDPAFMQQLAGTAIAMTPDASPSPWRGRSVRVGLATATVAVISVGGAWATVSFIAPEEPNRSPQQEPTAPGRSPAPTSSTETPHDSVVSPRPGPRQSPGRGEATQGSRPESPPGLSNQPTVEPPRGPGQNNGRNDEHGPGQDNGRNGELHGQELGPDVGPPGLGLDVAPGQVRDPKGKGQDRRRVNRSR